MLLRNILLILGLLLLAASPSSSERVGIDEALGKFLGAMERYANTVNDVVFLLDESGSIGADKFPQVKLFAKLTAQRLSVSADNSRVAVVPFATEPRTPIDYIKNPNGNNMCTLLREIDDITYVAEWTHTDKAMRAAENIFARARPNSNKIIVLLTDGQSNDGHSPIQIAQRLKQSGIIIFAVGVADVNVAEINAVATSPDHVYILKDFDYIVKVNIYLVNDTRELSMVVAKSNSYCNALCTEQQDCCDANANCYCGTRTGRYECACNAGYQGRGGYKGHCHKCPKGTYKSESRNAECTACPPHSTTVKEGSTSFSECICEPGYERFGNYCAPVRCATLTPPEGGILIPTHCNNTYGTQCSFKCREGFCPFSCNGNNALQSANQHSAMPSRTCLETREWTGEEFHCEKMTCPALHFPENGNHNCSEKDFTFGTTCRFQCNKGFEISGPKTRTCLFNSWTGDEVTCKGIFCDPLKTNALLHVKRTACGTNPMPYQSVCQYHCSDGYILVHKGNKTDGVLRCEDNKKWSGGYSGISCKDNEPPKIKCPKSIEIDAEPFKSYAHVMWNLPNATDNVPKSVVKLKIVEPQNLRKSPTYKKNQPAFYFPIGRTKVVYEATDYSKLSSTCSFSVLVLDKEPPKVVSCPADIEIYHHTNDAIPVIWEEPVFEDNSKKLKSVTSSRKSGNKFGWGPAVTVNYTATDEANNTAICSFQVKVKHYPCPYYDPPANGIVTCDDWLDGRMCKVFCHDGFQFATGRNFDRTYLCKQVTKSDGTIEGSWHVFRSGKRLQMPWPDCTRKQKPAALNATVGLKFGVDSCSEESLQKFREKFMSIQAFKLDIFCPKNKGGCSPENVKINCSPARARRSLRSDAYNNFSEKSRRDVPQQVLTISFNVHLFPNATDDDTALKPTNVPGDEDKIDLSSSEFMKNLENEIAHKVKDAYKVDVLPEPEVQYNVTVVCSVGQISVNNTCVNCPAGTYKDDVSETCIDCSTATYQDEERQLSCKACPKGFTTYGVKSKSAGDCKGPCQPGTYSETMFEPCLACPLNTYQERAARKECKKCATGLYTWRVGANSSSDCVAPCKPGTFSGNGYEPCSMCQIGSFQEVEGQTNCTICPNRTTTKIKGAKHSDDCKEFDICAEDHPCQNNATCIQLDKDYECRCPDGLMGKLCEINLDDCASSPCLNNGTCVDEIGNFTCRCLEGWTGRQCQTNKDDCASNPCLNGAECLDELNAYQCVCLPGFSGGRCERNIYECESNPCLHNGTCFDMQNGYRCCCTKDFYGPNCEHELIRNACDSVSCQNGGTCFGDEENFNCTCPQGFEGEHCETNIDDCKDHECENNGYCIDGIGHATCNCPQKFTGSRCETVLLHEYALIFPTPSTTNYVEINNVHRLLEITVAFFMRTSFKDPNSRATPVSYSYMYKDHLVDNALTVMDTNNFVLYIHGSTIHTEYTANSNSDWHHYAVTWQKMGGKWAFYVDGKTITSGQHLGEDKYMHPGTFVLGQEQDSVGSMFSALEAFAGDITEFNVWNYAMTPDEIKRISLSCGNMGNVIPWNIVHQYVSGDVQISEDVDKCESLGHCQENSCHCYYTTDKEEDALDCKNALEVNVCDANSCENDQLCLTMDDRAFCSCDEQFDGRRCEYDVDECLEKNGGCEYICVNDVGTMSNGSYHCECPDDLILSGDGKTCIDTAYCLKDGQTYMNGETWVNNCQNCGCNGGVIECEDIECIVTSCLPEETLLMSPGECCPKCVAWSFCVISSKSTIMSFDLSKYEISSRCNYTAVEDCIGGRFKVDIEFPPNGTNLVIYQDCSKMTISSDGSVFLDDDAAGLPLKNDLWNVQEVNTSVSIRTSADLIVDWDLENEVVISLPITHINKVCGLCSKMEEYYTYSIGKFTLSERWARGEKECFIVSEGYEENMIMNGSLTLLPSASLLPVYILVAFLTYIRSNFLT